MWRREIWLTDTDYDDLNTYNDSSVAGALLLVGGLQWFMTVKAAETLFPGYSTRANDFSDLASTVPPNTSLVQP
jgi:hypothetical protein